jgi:hypothetical protein
MYKIYVLIDPTTKTIRYVGRTNQGHIKRLNRHIRDSKKQTNHKANWIKSIINNGNLPLILIVENNLPSIEEANLAEIHYIKSFKSLGCDLTNATDGGGGANGFKHSQKTIDKLKTLSHPHSEETKLLLKSIGKDRFKTSLTHPFKNRSNRKKKVSCIEITPFEKLLIEFIKKNPTESKRSIAKKFNTNPMKIIRALRKEQKIKSS